MQEYKCPCCGGAVEFNSGLQKLQCPFCDTEFDIDALSSHNDSVENATGDNLNWDSTGGQEWSVDEQTGLYTYLCQSCGGEIVADETTGATSCPYCGNKVVMQGHFSGSLKPDFVIPFKLDKKAAKAALMKHVTGKKLLPKIFKDTNHIDEIKGVYVPFWLFDAGVNANVNYKATQVRHWSDRNYDYTETSYYGVYRAGNIAFQSVPVDGSTKMPDDLMESVEPFDLKEAVPFNSAYLAGYLADKYDVDAQSSIPRANERIKRSTEDAFRETVQGYNSVTTENSSINLLSSQSHYALYPVWILNTTWNGEKYTFAMNGQTGKFVGNLPMDKKKYMAYFAGLFGGVAAAALGLFYVLTMFIL